MMGLGVDSVGLAPTLLEHTMVTKGVLVVNNSVMDPESGGTEVSLLPGHFKNIFFSSPFIENICAFNCETLNV